MNKSLLWRWVVILAVVAGAAYLAFPPKDKIKLGLDLRGGMHLVLRVETQDALRSETDQDMERLVQSAREAGVTGLATRRLDPEPTAEEDGEAPPYSPSFEVTGVPRDKDRAIDDIVEQYLAGWDWERDGERLVFTMDPGYQSQLEDQSVRQALQTIGNRVDEYGVAEPVIHREGLGGNRIVVQLPGVDDPERVKGLIKNTAFLELRLAVYPREGGFARSREEVVRALGGNVANVDIVPQEIRDEQGRVLEERYYAVERQSVITGRDLRNARAALGEFNNPIVQFYLSPEGARSFSQATGNNIGRALVIILDNKVQSAPVIEDRISDSGIIRGQFTPAEAEDLATVLRTGALPAGITVLEERTVGPSLGQDSIEQGIRAGLWGGMLVVLAMIIVYTLSSVNVILALVLDVVLVFGALASLDATLTLPGIAGIVLTIGMAVDANVLVFERIREELRAGKTVKTAVASGFDKALSSILDANITTLIAALFLFNFGTGPIRGFAVTLSIGILASLFTAVFMSRALFDAVLARQQRVEKLYI